MSRVGSIGNVGRFQPEERRAPISKLGAQFAEKRQEEAETNSRATRIKITQQQKDNFSAAFGEGPFIVIALRRSAGLLFCQPDQQEACVFLPFVRSDLLISPFVPSRCD
jgi:hypothetical protein